MSQVKYFDHNNKGNDYVVGDLHGCYQILFDALNAINFDFDNDRLFSVGDLVDRGPDSHKTALLIDENWFHAIRGNHEDMFLDAFLSPSDPYIDHNQVKYNYLHDYGKWARYNDVEMSVLAHKLVRLPLLIVVGKDTETRFNIVHGEILKQGDIASNSDIDNWTFNRDEINQLVWGRLLAGYTYNSYNPDKFICKQENMSTTYVGHTPVSQLIKIESQIYIDRGAVFSRRQTNDNHINALAIAQPLKNIIHEWYPTKNELVTVDQDDIIIKENKQYGSTNHSST